MSSQTNYLKEQLSDHLLSGTAFPVVSAAYAALFSGATTDGLTDGGADEGEVAAGGYARVLVTSGFTFAAGVATFDEVEFPQATASWGTISHFAIFDALTSGNALLHGPLSGTKAIESGDVAKFVSGQLTVTFE